LSRVKGGGSPEGRVKTEKGQFAAVGEQKHHLYVHDEGG